LLSGSSGEARRISSSLAATRGWVAATTLSPSQPSLRTKSITQTAARSGIAAWTMLRAVSAGSSEESKSRLAPAMND
jgi:hypothetical protein